MPIYPFVCISCKNRDEKILPMSEAAVDQKCPKCGGVAKRSYKGYKLHGYVCQYDERRVALDARKQLGIPAGEYA